MTRPELREVPRRWLVAAIVVALAVLTVALRDPARALAVAMGALILARCAWVVNTLHPAARDRPYLPWLAFGVSYALLAISACGSAAQIVEGRAGAGDWLWLLASTGLIVFDRRGRVAT